MTGPELRNFARVTEIFVAPAPPLPPVRETDAAPALERSLAAGPRLNALVLRALLLFIGAVLRALSPETLDRGPLKPLMKAVRSLAHLHYYGDERVMRLLGYDADAVLARAAEVRAAC